MANHLILGVFLYILKLFWWAQLGIPILMIYNQRSPQTYYF